MAAAKPVRNLAILFSDVGPYCPPPPFIDLVNDTPFGWENHCGDIIRNGGPLEFHLLSANLDFSGDTSDPASPTRGENAWGLTHALAALARRRPHDGHGNHLPLAWELRSLTNTNLAENADALRTYGLLRSLAAQPQTKGGRRETLAECLWREYRENHGRDPSLSPAEWSKASPHAMFREDLRNRLSAGSDIRAAIKRLLPIWRGQFLAAVKRADCHIDRDAAEAILRRLNVPHLQHDKAAPLVIPIRGSGDADWGLDVFSAFADMAMPDGKGGHVLSPEKTALFITTRRDVDPPRSIAEWYAAVVTAAGGSERSNLRDFRKVIREAEERIAANDLQSLLPGTRLTQPQKGMLFCFLVARALIVDKDVLLNPPAVDERYRVEGVSGGQWFRGFKGSSPPWAGRPDVLPVVTPTTFVGDLNNALRGRPVEHIEAHHWEWLRSGLLEWIGSHRDEAFQARARDRAPGLFPGELGAPDGSPRCPACGHALN